tara:strand:- start:2840 stop:3946 length:1107 start_codon:yes stop_codon:yes gene_type:complete
MSETKIGSADYGNLLNTGTDYSVDAVTTDAGGDQTETEWQNSNWSSYLGYYKAIPELQISIDAKATWTVGKGFQASDIEQYRLGSIIGFGKDTFNSILENMIRTYHIGGDAFAEIIRTNNGQLINLKPLDAGQIKIIVNSKGLIKRYEQVSKIKGASKKKFKPVDIFHLSRKRVADEIHGISLIAAVEWIILARNEAMADMKQLMHRHVKPRIVFKLDTDDTSQISAFKVKADKASDQGENLFIPMGAVEHEVLSVPANSTLNPLPWIAFLNNAFYQATGVPQIIVGGSQEFTEATAKIAYLAFEQTIEEEQLYIEEQVLNQLGFVINLEFPASLENELLSDKAKSETTQASTTEDTSVKGVGLGRTA